MSDRMPGYRNNPHYMADLERTDRAEIERICADHDWQTVEMWVIEIGNRKTARKPDDSDVYRDSILKG